MITSKKRLKGYNYYERHKHYQEQQTNDNATVRGPWVQGRPAMAIARDSQA